MLSIVQLYSEKPVNIQQAIPSIIDGWMEEYPLTFISRIWEWVIPSENIDFWFWNFLYPMIMSIPCLNIFKEMIPTIQIRRFLKIFFQIFFSHIIKLFLFHVQI